MLDLTILVLFLFAYAIGMLVYIRLGSIAISVLTFLIIQLSYVNFMFYM
jgi:hypothetical protein